MKRVWELVNIGEFCKVIAGQSPKGKYYNDAGDGLPFYQGKKDFGPKFIGSPTKWTTHVTKEALEGDILMSVRAPVGPINFATEKVCIGRGLAAIRATERVDHNFLYYGLLSMQHEINGNEGAVFASINKKQIEEIQLPLPPLPEQKRIVAILDGAFERIAAAVVNTEKNLVNARELFENHLTTIFSQKGDGWVEKKLGDVCHKIQDGAHHSPKKLYSEKETGRFLYITSKNIRNNYMDLSKIQYVDSDFHETIYPRCNPERGDVLLTKDGASTGNVTLNTIDEQFSLLSSVCLIKPDLNYLHPSFLKYYIQSRPGFEQITGKMTGAAIKRIILKTIKAATIPITKLNEQENIVKSLDDLFKQTQLLETIYKQKLTALTELKQSILQKAFAGELIVLTDKTSEESVA